MSEKLSGSVLSELQRARKALISAKILLREGMFEDCVSRAYYTILHAAKAALQMHGVEAHSHRAVQRLFSLHLVKTGEIEKIFSKLIMLGQEDRNIGDYEVDFKIDKDRAKLRVDEAERFVQRIEQYLAEK